MSKDDIKPAHSYLTENNEWNLKKLLKHAKELALLNQQLIAYLDKALVPYCKVANLSGNKLVLMVANGAIATNIRFQTPNLLRKFKENPLFSHIEMIQCKVRPPQKATLAAAPRKPAPISAATIHMITELADTINDHKLREAMLRIAKHAAERNSDK